MNKGSGYIDQIVFYIKRNLKKGYTKESLKWALVGQGHSKVEIERALERAEKELALEAPILETKPVIKREIITDEGVKYTDSKNIKKDSFWKRMFG